MALLKTYTCDFPGCNKQNAAHILVPGVDYQDDPADGKRYPIDGYVDLCQEHSTSIVELIFNALNPPTADRRSIWKKLLRKA